MPGERLEALAAKFGITPPPAVVQHPAPASAVDVFIVNGVHYRGGIYRVEWSKQLLDSKAGTQDYWLRRAGDAFADARLYHESMVALYACRNASNQDVVLRIREMFRQDFQQGMMTASRIAYRPGSHDSVMHKYGISQEVTYTNIVGDDGWITSASGLESQMDALLGTDDLDEIERVHTWITGKRPYFWRLNNNPNKIIERPVVLSCIGSGFVISAVGILGTGRVRPVAVREIKAPADYLEL